MTAVFSFEAGGTGTVRIVGVASSCGCAAALLEKREYAPGETGAVKVVFEFGGRQGWQEKKIWVVTDDPVEPRVELKLKVHIPEVVMLSPTALWWSTNEAPVEKVMRAVLTNAPPGTAISGAGSVNSHFVVSLREVEAGRVYEVAARPSSTAFPATGVLMVTGRFPNGVERVFRAYALVKEAVPNNPGG